MSGQIAFVFHNPFTHTRTGRGLLNIAPTRASCHYMAGEHLISLEHISVCINMLVMAAEPWQHDSSLPSGKDRHCPLCNLLLFQFLFLFLTFPLTLSVFVSFFFSLSLSLSILSLSLFLYVCLSVCLSGEYSYLGTTLRQAHIEPMPSLSDVRQLMALYGILPLGERLRGSK